MSRRSIDSSTKKDQSNISQEHSVIVSESVPDLHSSSKKKIPIKLKKVPANRHRISDIKDKGNVNEKKYSDRIIVPVVKEPKITSSRQSRSSVNNSVTEKTKSIKVDPFKPHDRTFKKSATYGIYNFPKDKKEAKVTEPIIKKPEPKVTEPIVKEPEPKISDPIAPPPKRPDPVAPKVIDPIAPKVTEPIAPEPETIVITEPIAPRPEPIVNRPKQKTEEGPNNQVGILLINMCPAEKPQTPIKIEEKPEMIQKVVERTPVVPTPEEIEESRLPTNTDVGPIVDCWLKPKKPKTGDVATPKVRSLNRHSLKCHVQKDNTLKYETDCHDDGWIITDSSPYKQATAEWDNSLERRAHNSPEKELRSKKQAEDPSFTKGFDYEPYRPHSNSKNSNLEKYRNVESKLSPIDEVKNFSSNNPKCDKNLSAESKKYKSIPVLELNVGSNKSKDNHKRYGDKKSSEKKLTNTLPDHSANRRKFDEQRRNQKINKSFSSSKERLIPYPNGAVNDFNSNNATNYSSRIPEKDDEGSANTNSQRVTDQNRIASIPSTSRSHNKVVDTDVFLNNFAKYLTEIKTSDEENFSKDKVIDQMNNFKQNYYDKNKKLMLKDTNNLSKKDHSKETLDKTNRLAPSSRSSEKNNEIKINRTEDDSLKLLNSQKKVEKRPILRSETKEFDITKPKHVRRESQLSNKSINASKDSPQKKKQVLPGTSYSKNFDKKNQSQKKIETLKTVKPEAKLSQEKKELLTKKTPGINTTNYRLMTSPQKVADYKDLPDVYNTKFDFDKCVNTINQQDNNSSCDSQNNQCDLMVDKSDTENGDEFKDTIEIIKKGDPMYNSPSRYEDPSEYQISPDNRNKTDRYSDWADESPAEKKMLETRVSQPSLNLQNNLPQYPDSLGITETTEREGSPTKNQRRPKLDSENFITTLTSESPENDNMRQITLDSMQNDDNCDNLIISIVNAEKDCDFQDMCPRDSYKPTLSSENKNYVNKIAPIKEEHTTLDKPDNEKENTEEMFQKFNQFREQVGRNMSEKEALAYFLIKTQKKTYK